MSFCFSGPFGSPDFIDRQQGLLPALSFVPHWTLPFSDNMSFFERWFNTIVTVYDWALRTYAFLPTEEEYTKKHFSHLAPLPSLSELHKNVSLILVNTHRALSPPRPSLPSKLCDKFSNVRIRLRFTNLNVKDLFIIHPIEW